MCTEPFPVSPVWPKRQKNIMRTSKFNFSNAFREAIVLSLKLDKLHLLHLSEFQYIFRDLNLLNRIFLDIVKI